jgi:hypothetical protein
MGLISRSLAPKYFKSAKSCVNLLDIIKHYVCVLYSGNKTLIWACMYNTLCILVRTNFDSIVCQTPLCFIYDSILSLKESWKIMTMKHFYEGGAKVGIQLQKLYRILYYLIQFYLINNLYVIVCIHYL